MKRILFFSILFFASTVLAQSPTAFRSLDLVKSKNLVAPIEYNAWAGSTLSYPLVGQDFDLTFGISGKIVIDFTKFKLGREWYILTYGNLGLPNYNRVSIYDNVVSAENGISVGLQGYTIFGDLQEKALTTYADVVAKLNTFGSTQVNTYRLGSGVELSLRGGGLPIILNVSPAYVLVDNKTTFAKLQSETTGKGFWVSDAFVIVPVGDRLGILTQATFTENASPQVRVGIIVASGL